MEFGTFEHRSGQWGAFPTLDSERTALFVFGSRGLLDDPAPLAALSEAFPEAHVVGCSSAGEIHGDLVSDDTISVAALRLDHGTVRSAAVEVSGPEGSREAGAALAAALAGDDLRAIFVLAEGLSINGSELAAGLAGALPPGVIVTGGLAGDGARFEATWVLRDRLPQTQAVCALGLYGAKLRVGYGSRGGWDIFGPTRTVTRSEGNVLYELDGEPALALYKQYLGDQAADLPSSGLLFPLSIQDGERELVRTILAVDEEAQSLTFAGDIPQGCRAQLMKANFDRLVDGAQAAASMAQAGPEPVLCVAISCVGRRLVLGERVEDEVEATLEALPEGSGLVGFYSYGELSPLGTGSCDLHNQTMTLTTLGEDA